MLTVPARLPEPYVHTDNRGLIICNGAHCVFIHASQLRMCAETFEIIATEGRATRGHGDHILGGYHSGGDVVLYAGRHDNLLSVTLTAPDFAALREAMPVPVR